jgi:ribosomal protein S27E
MGVEPGEIFCWLPAGGLFIMRALCNDNQVLSKGRFMDVIFNCPKCEQELAVDSSGAGTEINCPSCGEAIVIPSGDNNQPRLGVDNAPGAPRVAGHPINPIATSAAAKVERHLRVPVHTSPAASLIEKPLVPLEAAKDADKTVHTKTIRHGECIEVGHDKFDEIVSKFLAKVGEANIISINTISYSHVDIGSQKILNDFGVLVVYKG